MKRTGGKRPGAGRHRIYGAPMLKQTIRIPQEHLHILREIDPNLSKSIRAIIDDKAAQSAIREIIKRRNHHATDTDAHV